MKIPPAGISLICKCAGHKWSFWKQEAYKWWSHDLMQSKIGSRLTRKCARCGEVETK